MQRSNDLQIYKHLTLIIFLYVGLSLNFIKKKSQAKFSLSKYKLDLNLKRSKLNDKRDTKFLSLKFFKLLQCGTDPYIF